LLRVAVGISRLMAVSEVPASECPIGDDGEFTGFPAFDRPIRFVVVRAENVARFDKAALGFTQN
jgi:hypothetical protein